MKRITWFSTVILLFSFNGPAHAAGMKLEIIPLKHRLTNDVIPIVRPLVVPGGTVTGSNNQLIIRSTPANLAEIKRVLSSIDAPPRQLKISVRQGVAADFQGNEQGLSGAYRSGDFGVAAGDGRRTRDGVVISGRGSRGEIRYGASNRRSQTDRNNVHFVRAVEGRPAYIHTGQSVPLPRQDVTFGPSGAFVRDSVQYRDVTSGFYVLPYISGQRVTLHIAPRMEELQQRGRVDVQRAESTVSGRLGTWFELGGVAQNFNNNSSGYLSRSSGRGREDRQIWVKVEDAANIRSAPPR